MAGSHPRHDSPSGNSSPSPGPGGDDDTSSVLGAGLTSRHIEAFGRKVTTTAGHLIGPMQDAPPGGHYQAAVNDIHKELRRPSTQRRMFSLAQTTPTDLVRSKLSTTEIQSRAISSLPDELLVNIPDDTSSYSLFQGFQASMPEDEHEHRKSHRRRSSRSQKLLDAAGTNAGALPPTISSMKKERDAFNRRLEMMGIRKNMCSAEIHEIDNKIANLHSMRKIVLDRLARLEMDEADLEHDLVQLDNKLEDMEEEAATRPDTPKTNDATDPSVGSDSHAMDASFMSESIYEKIPSPKTWKQKSLRKRSMPILHEHFEPGSLIKELEAHNDMVSAIDFDVPFGTMVSAALDDTVRVWDLNLGRCMGFLEGHHASVRCLQVEDNLVATGSMDATIRLWDLSRAKYAPRDNRIGKDGEQEDDEDALGYEDPSAAPPPPPPSSMEDCPLYSLESHLAEVTALHFRGDTLISGSADKTLRQWDLVKGRCVQTLDVLWAAAQASTISSNDNPWRPTGRLPDASADFVGAVQCFDAALACGTADGMVRLWDLRSGQVHRSLVGHTGPVTCLQFDDVHLVTGSMDRSIRIWDLRTGSIYDAFAYDNPITSMMFDTRRIVSAAGEDVVKVYDKTEGRHWSCGAGVTAEEEGRSASIVERVRIKDGYLTEGRKDGTIGVWTC
ncbi:mitochondrial division protein 1 [Helicocarpus griseus UAMH5409]|uniref:Mitochondrial division protein 1 n=1 Tax=Helicocarpus griseus UAMH5409 TaxID=1447875 RepID=A0A2B7WHA7_9EURO|nr:mitochondrial division protein 1 [Helicocarpus griseus UAMH5409]